MEALDRLSRRQVDALAAIPGLETPERGASLTQLAARLKVRPPTALAHLTAMERLGLVARHRGKSRLTERGSKTLLEYRRHHRIAEGLFQNLGLTTDQVCAAAREVDLALSHRTVERLCQAEDHPQVCPHGQPIPRCETDQGRDS